MIKGLELFKTWWVVILGLISLVTAWTSMQNTAAALTERVGVVETKIEVLNKNREDMNIKLEKVANDVSWIRATLSGYKIEVQ